MVVVSVLKNEVFVFYVTGERRQVRALEKGERKFTIQDSKNSIHLLDSSVQLNSRLQIQKRTRRHLTVSGIFIRVFAAL